MTALARESGGAVARGRRSTRLVISAVCLMLALLAEASVVIQPASAFFQNHQRQHHHHQRHAEPVQEIDLYEVLGLDDEATATEIKKAYRALSLKYHPDKNPGESAKFAEVSRAYEILSDEELKYVFDFSGMAGVKEHEEMKKHQQQGGGHDPFAAFFGGGQRRSNRGPNAQVEMQVTLEQMYNGATTSARIARRVVCRGCADDNPKAKTKERCRTCGRCPPETRTVHRQMGNGFIVQQQEQVQSKHRCKNEDKDLEVIVEKGAPHEAQIHFPYASEQRPGQVPGDITVVLKQRRHAVFERRENNLHMTAKITLKEALTGFTRKVVHLDGHTVDISPGTGEVIAHQQTKVFVGEGMPLHEVPSQFGDLLVTFDVTFPKTLTQEQREALEKVF